MADSGPRIFDSVPPAERLRDVIALHLELLDGGFLSSLGPGFLSQVFLNVAHSPNGVLLWAEDEGRVVGYLMGSVDTRAVYQRFLLRRSIFAAPYLLPHLVRFGVWRKVWETLRYPTKSELPDLPAAELLDFGVAASHQGTGLAQRIFEAFVERLAEKGVGRFRITSGGELERAHGFYEKVGAYPVGEIEIHKGQPTKVFCYDVTHA